MSNVLSTTSMEGNLSNETVSPMAGKPASQEMLVDVTRLEREYFERLPDIEDPNQLVSFGTSGHRGSSLRGSFNEFHVLTITQAICDYRRTQGTNGPLYMGKDTHALSTPAQYTALEALAANGVDTVIQQNGGVTPTPVISRAILVYNRERKQNLADGIVVTPSHNPPEDGDLKYNPPHGGPADTAATRWIEDRDNGLLRAGNASVKRMTIENAVKAATIHEEDFIIPYVNDLRSVVDMEAFTRMATAAESYAELETIVQDAIVASGLVEFTRRQPTPFVNRLQLYWEAWHPVSRIEPVDHQMDVAFEAASGSSKH
jgi:phosphoglucomutase